MLLSILHSCLIQYSTEDEVSISLEKNSTTTPLFECGALPRRHRAAHIWKKTYILLFYLHGKVKVLYTTSLPHSMMPLKPFLPTYYHTPVSQFLLSYFSWGFYILKVKAAAIRISNTNNRDYFVNKGLQILLSSCNNVDCSIFRLCTGSMNIIKLLIHSLVSYKSQFKTSKVIQNCTRRRNSRWDSTWLIHCWTLQVHGFWVLWIYGSMLGSIRNHLKFL